MKILLSSRWYILGLTLAATFLIIGVSRLCLPVLFKEISADLNLDLVAVGAIWGIDSLAGVFTSLPSGLIVDRFGVKKTMAVICLICAIFGGLRGFSTDFMTLAATSFAFGLAATTIATVGTKVTAVWFRDRYLKLSNSLIFIFMYIGQMVGSTFSAAVFSPLMGGWRNVMFLYALPVLITGVLWFTVRDRLPASAPPGKASQKKAGMFQGLMHIIRLRSVWILAIVFSALLGSIIAINGYLSIYLRGQGWDAAGSSGALTLMIASAFVGTVPVIFTNTKFMSAKAMLIVSMALMSVCSALFGVVSGPGVLVLSVLAGFLRAAPSVLLTVLVLEIPEVGAEHAGTAIGFTYTIGLLWAFILPPLGNSLASIDPGLPFVFWSALSLLSLIGFFFYKKPGIGPAHQDCLK